MFDIDDHVKFVPQFAAAIAALFPAGVAVVSFYFGFDRGFEDDSQRRPAYYLIVYARNEQGHNVRRKIEDAETHQFAVVERWAEQVPKPVYDRLKEDKKADGVLSETLFSVKERGYRNEEIRLLGTDGKPIGRGAQITTL